ncbi:DUF4194 domain-containing protein [Acinetobacter haemolyticus]|uniref:DUF4194 domain-containing protein n=1 Tax=Acinetobacter haemolyticus TaxID=29430 RepID=A0A857ILU6_ACIHA|nr:DUF4194 domain-containing protein [Acinetobacter haemolyticus]ENW19186.1 hypothetical protein F926_02747 [Acinetobacter haemolyticus NIPH 261]NAR67900.1 DUF4194 domain-containing protein [Acinetobacter haemolyticus]NAR83863.1 DUF4194 domain-containing protein [Acinetobacter haemolyticus]QHI10747.1 DUF4194 domain-containing protein [Acinetobacter haemolyticus]QHI14017.1 DUF4194 domain-containing protein [Acinetobacter haemolyticus]
MQDKEISQLQDASFFDRVRRPSIDEPHHAEQNKIMAVQDELAEVETEQESENDSAQLTDELSSMPHEARRVLVYLMRQGTILAAENLKLFDVLCRYEVAIRQHLAEVYIQLILDARQGVAYIINVESISDENADNQFSDDFPTLIRKRTLTLYDTLVLLILRKYYQERENAGEQKIIIDLERIQTSLIPFIPMTNHDSKDRKKLTGTLDKFSEKKILSVIRGEEGRYEITPIIRYVVNAEFLQSLLTEYEQLADKAVQSEQNKGKA